jgi:hypothetical protein
MTLRKVTLASFFCLATLTAMVSRAVYADTADSIRQYEKDARDLPAGGVAARTMEPPTAARAAWTGFQKRHAGWTATWDVATGTPVRSTGPAIKLERSPSTSAQAADLARGFLLSEASAWVKSDELTPVRASQDRNGWWVQYTQSYKGLRVVGARAFARISSVGTVPLFGLLLHPRIDIETTPVLDEAAARSAARADFPTATPSDVTAVERVVLPVFRNGTQGYRSAYLISFKTRNPFGSWEAYVDAETGELLWRRSLLESIDITGSVSAGIEPVTQGSSIEVRALPHLAVSLADTGAIADTVTASDGSFLLSAPSGGPHSLKLGLSGPFAFVNNLSFGNSPLEVGFDPDSNTVFPIVFDDTNSRVQDRDAFYWAMRTHDFIRVVDPAFSSLDYPMYLVTDYPDQQCNAFWDGYGLVFFASGNVCVDMARIASVVVHEYGHGITDYQYRPFSPSADMHEGFSDYTAATLLNDPRIGVGFFGPGTVLRTVENNRHFPEDVTTDPHANGLILAGAIWDVRKVLGAETTDYLWHFARNGFSANFDDYFFDFLVTDDDDGNVYNGTPHFNTIVNAFLHHGIGDYGIHVAHVPLRDTEDASASFPLTASFLSIYAIDDASVQVHLAIDHGLGPVEETRPLLPTGGVREYSTLLEAQPNETLVSYWFTAEDTAGTGVVFPPGGSQNPFHLRIGIDTTPPHIVHVPLRDQPLDAARIAVRAQVTDNLNKGIDSVRVVHVRESDPEGTTTLLTAGNDLYAGSMSFPGAQLGDAIKYRIQVADSAVVPNVATSPETGWNVFHIVRGFGRDFEDNDGGLTAAGGWEWGTPEPLQPAFSGAKVWGTNLGGTYPENALESLVVGPVDLSSFNTAGLYFQNFYNTEPFYDSGAVYASTDSGATWQRLVPDGEYPFGIVLTGQGGYSGESGDWVPAEFPLDAYVGVSHLLLKFEFQSDEAVGGLGWYVDDLEVADRQVLSRPLALKAVSGKDSQVPLNWKTPVGIAPPAPGNPLLGYQVYRGFPGAEPARLTSTPVLETHYVDLTPVNGTAYMYSVRAVYEDGESPPSNAVEGMPYVATFSGSTDTLRVTSGVGETANATIHVGNTGTGFLKVNLWPVPPGQTLANTRIRYTIPTGPGTLHPQPDWGAKAKPRSILPPGTWQLLYQDAQDHADANVPDIDSLEAQVGPESIYLRITGHRPWGDPTSAWTLLASFDTDLDPGTHPQGDFAILAGAAAQAAVGAPAVLIDPQGHIAGPVHYVSFPSPNVMEFGIFLASIGSPEDVFLTVRATDPTGNNILDLVPDAAPLPWLGLDTHRVELAQGTEQDLAVHFFSLSAGEYLGQILMETNDPLQPLLVLPVSFTAGTLVPVDLLSFQGEAGDLGIRLEWTTANETDLRGFRVLRSDAAGGMETTLTPNPLTGDHGAYAFDDRDVVDGRDYWYRLEAIDRTGDVQFHGPLQVHYVGVSNLTNVLLRPSTPNPTRNATSIRFGLPADAAVSVRVFSVDGRLVRVLADGVHFPRGFHELAWDGRDMDGRQVGAGVFAYQLNASGAVRRGKITVLR